MSIGEWRMTLYANHCSNRRHCCSSLLDSGWLLRCWLHCSLTEWVGGHTLNIVVLQANSWVASSLCIRIYLIFLYCCYWIYGFHVTTKTYAVRIWLDNFTISYHLLISYNTACFLSCYPSTFQYIREKIFITLLVAWRITKANEN